MADLNQVTLIGRLGKNIELKHTQKGTAVARVSLAVNSWNGTEEQANWIPVVFYSKTAERAAQYLSKGSRIAVEGSIRTWEAKNQDGSTRVVVEVIVFNFHFLDTKSDNSTQGQQGNPYTQQPTYQAPQQNQGVQQNTQPQYQQNTPANKPQQFQNQGFETYSYEDIHTGGNGTEAF